MKITNKVTILIFLIILISAGFFYFKNIQAEDNEEKLGEAETVLESENDENKTPKDIVQIIQVEDGQTYGELMKSSGISVSLANEIYESSLETYDLASLRAGKEIKLFFDPGSKELKSLLYSIDSESELVVKNLNYFPTVADLKASSTEEVEVKENIWQAEVKAIDYEVKVVEKEGELASSLYNWALENNVDERAIIEMANAFQWSLDFAMDPRVGDTFKFIYEERYLNGNYIMPGQLLAAKYVNEGENYEVYYFEESEDNKGYFDREGNSVQKMFLKAPVAFKYISSGFTTGLRYISAFNISTGHRAIDYAAAYGTPIRTVGDGTVVMAKYNGSYGNMVSVRHNGTYSTNYGHMSKFAVSYGEKAKQGDIIGYIGSTGLSTGPHLHYEMVKNGVKINPLLEVLPPGEPIKEENKERFFESIKSWQEKLNN
ncbi:MAG: M23 family metallopeptidase [Candidatus Pacebacteria bacterium]|nr:M23 family metallopeptidase [Candidatus Paceibacterota bacterium]